MLVVVLLPTATLLPLHCCPVTTTLLPCYCYTVALLPLHCYPITATLLPYYHYTVTLLPLHCYPITATLLPYYCYTVTPLLLHCYTITAILLPYYRYTVTILLLHCYPATLLSHYSPFLTQIPTQQCPFLHRKNNQANAFKYKGKRVALERKTAQTVCAFLLEKYGDTHKTMFMSPG